MIQPPTRSPFRAALLVATTSMVFVAGCGKKGDPLPPLSSAPAAANDLTVRQQGGVLIFDQGYPQTTVSGTLLSGVDALEVLDYVLPAGAESSSVQPSTFERGAEVLVRISGAELSGAIEGNRIRNRVALGDAMADDATHLLATRTFSPEGDASPVSNRVALQLSEPPPPPASLEVSSTADGVMVSWTAEPPENENENENEGTGFHVYRKQASQRSYGEPLVRVDSTTRNFTDGTAAFGQRYFYTVRTIISAEPLIESEAAVETEVDHQDVFAPAPPSRVTGLAEEQQIRLLLEASPAEDVDGYVIFRREPGSESFRRLNDELVRTLEYTDRGLVSGLSYEYQVAAVDLAGNEGDPSEAVSVEAR